MNLIKTLQYADISLLPVAERDAFATNIAIITDTESQVEEVKALNWLKYAVGKYNDAGLRKILTDYEQELAGEKNDGFNTDLNAPEKIMHNSVDELEEYLKKQYPHLDSKNIWLNTDDTRREFKLQKVTPLDKLTSASSIECLNGKLYIIGDDAAHLLVADTDLKNQKYIRLFPGEGRLPKMEKEDLEASAIINKGSYMLPDRYLLIAGSGSLPNRGIFIVAPINNLSEFKKIDATPFYNRIKEKGVKNLNIEGMSSIGSFGIVMVSRGNRTNPENYFIVTSTDFYEHQEDAPIYLVRMELPEKTMTMSGLCYMVNRDTLLFTVSDEDSPDAIADGAIGDSRLGWISGFTVQLREALKQENAHTKSIIEPDDLFNLAENDVRFKNQKIEGVCVEDSIDKSMTKYLVHLVADNDNGSSKVFTATLNIPEKYYEQGGLPRRLHTKIYYNSHGSTMPWKEFADLEVERGNNTRRGLKKLQQQYKISNATQVIWVTENPLVALSYDTEAEARNYRNKMSIDAFEKKYGVDRNSLVKFTDEDGYLIPETNDGDNGFLMVLKSRPKPKKKDEPLTEQEIKQLQARWEKKKDRIMQLGNVIHRLRNNLTRDMKSDDEKDRLTALVIAIMDKTAERVGNEDSAGNGHHGVTGFKKKHIKIDGSTISIKYVGKSGVEQEKTFTDELIAKTLKQAIKDSPDKSYVFVTSDGFKIKSDRINRYLEDFKITAKDIRGYSANKFIVARLEKEEIEAEEKGRIKQFRKAAKHAAQKVGHGVATLKKHYMIPELEKQFVSGGQIINLSEFMKEGGVVNYPTVPEPKPQVVTDSAQAALTFPGETPSGNTAVAKNETVFEGEKSKFLGEIGVFYNKHSNQERVVIRTSRDASQFLHEIWDKHTLELQESFYVLYLNRHNRVIAWHAPFKGGVTGTVADTRIIVATAAKVLASSIVVAHNHPSGNLQPSNADKSLTNELSNALKPLEIVLADSLIITANGGYYSFADEGLLEKGGFMDMGGLFHGSSYDFDKFSSDKMGTGEGANAFGWGLYFTDIPAIAEHYADSAYNRAIEFKDSFDHDGYNYYIERGYAGLIAFKEDLSIENLGDRFSKRKSIPYNEYWAALKKEKNLSKNLYKITLRETKPAQDFRWLDWNKEPSADNMQRIKEQLKIENKYPVFDLGIGKSGRFKGEPLFKILEGKPVHYSGGLKGQNLYAELSGYLGSDEAASLFLLRAGIDGIRYPTESLSQHKHQPSGLNYVVFDPGIISIDEKIKLETEFESGGSVRSFGEGNELSKDLQDDELATMSAMFFANLHEGDLFKVGKKTIVVIKVVPDQYMKLLIGGVAKKISFQYGHFIGSKGMGHDWFDQLNRDVEGVLLVDLINRNNQFHEFSELWKIAHRDSIYQGQQYAEGGPLETKEDVLKQCTVNGNVVKLPAMQLDRKLYMDVAKALELIGGKWNRKEQGFVFSSDPTELLEQIAGGEKRNLKKEFQFFATPPDLADWLVQLAEIKPGEAILEPSAGQGAIVQAIHRKLPDVLVYCYELMPTNRAILSKLPGIEIIGEDFLNPDGKNTMQQMRFDTIIANPPFSKNQDIDHVREMYNCLKPGGRLVSIMSKHWQLSNNKKESEFRDWLKTIYATVEEIPAGKFKESGTSIPTVAVVIDKPKEESSKITEGDTVYFQKNTGETQSARAARISDSKRNLWLLIGPNTEKYEMEERHLSKDPNNVPNRIPQLRPTKEIQKLLDEKVKELDLEEFQDYGYNLWMQADTEKYKPEMRASIKVLRLEGLKSQWEAVHGKNVLPKQLTEKYLRDRDHELKYFIMADAPREVVSKCLQQLEPDELYNAEWNFTKAGRVHGYLVKHSDLFYLLLPHNLEDAFLKGFDSLKFSNRTNLKLGDVIDYVKHDNLNFNVSEEQYKSISDKQKIEPPQFDNLTEYSVVLRQPETVTFYHGTDAQGKKGIAQKGFDVKNYEFYATTDINSAISFGCDKDQDKKRKKYTARVISVVPLATARILNMGNPFVAADLGFGTKEDNHGWIRYGLHQADIDDYARKEGYDAYIFADSRSGGGAEVNYATKTRWLIIINPAQFNVKPFGDFTCANAGRELEEGNKYLQEYFANKKLELEKYGYKEQAEFSETQKGIEQFDKLFAGLVDTGYDHTAYWPKHGYETIQDARYSLLEKPILDNIEKYYQQKPTEEQFREKMQKVIADKIAEFPLAEETLPDTSEIEVLATGRWCPESFKTNISTQGISDLQVTKIRIVKYGEIVYVRENVQLPEGGFGVSSQMRWAMKTKGSLPPGAVQILELAVPRHVYTNSKMYDDIKNIIHNADGHKRIVYANKQFTIEWAEAHIKKPVEPKDSQCPTGQVEVEKSNVVKGEFVESTTKVIRAFDNAYDLKKYVEQIGHDKSMHAAQTPGFKLDFTIPIWHHDKNGLKLWFEYKEGEKCPYVFETIKQETKLAENAPASTTFENPDLIGENIFINHLYSKPVIQKVLKSLPIDEGYYSASWNFGFPSNTSSWSNGYIQQTTAGHFELSKDGVVKQKFNTNEVAEKILLSQVTFNAPEAPVIITKAKKKGASNYDIHFSDGQIILVEQVASADIAKKEGLQKWIEENNRQANFRIEEKLQELWEILSEFLPANAQAEKHIKIGDRIITGYGTGPYMVEEINSFPEGTSLVLSDWGAKRTASGKLPKGYSYSYINGIKVVDGKLIANGEDVFVNPPALDLSSIKSGDRIIAPAAGSGIVAEIVSENSHPVKFILQPEKDENVYQREEPILPEDVLHVIHNDAEPAIETTGFHMSKKQRDEEIKELKRELNFKSTYESLRKEQVNAIRALQDNDTAYLEELAKYGEDIRHQTMNRADFLDAQQLGFEKFELDENGWYKKELWPHGVEEISFPAKGHSSAIGNNIQIAQGPNGKWTFGVHSNTGGSGGGWVPRQSPQKEYVYDTRDEVLQAAIEALKKTLKPYLTSTDRVNHKPEYIRAVLKEIDSYQQAGKVQQTLF